MQIIVVKQDEHAPDRVMLSVTEESGFGHTVRIEKQYLAKLSADLLKFAEPAINEEGAR
jgi:hypothetical protein